MKVRCLDYNTTYHVQTVQQTIIHKQNQGGVSNQAIITNI